MGKNLIQRRRVLTGLAVLPLVTAPFIRRAAAAEFSFKIAHPLAATHPTNLRLQAAADQIKKDADEYAARVRERLNRMREELAA